MPCPRRADANEWRLQVTVASQTNPILDAWKATLARKADAPAIFDSNGEVVSTFRDIELAAANAIPTEIQALGQGSVVAIQLGNAPCLPGILLALWRGGFVPLLLDRSLDGPARENALAACGASAWLGMDETHSTGHPLQFRTLPGTPFADDTQFLKLTSGTTGCARAIRFTAAQLLADCESVCDTMGIREDDLNYGVIPWSHSYGFTNLVTPLLCRGVPVVATEDRMPRAILDGLARTGATVLPGLPVFFHKLADLACGPLPRLRLCISAGAPLQAATASAFRTKFGIKLHSFYGSSECGGIAYDASEAEATEGCVGQPMRGVSIEYEDAGDASRIRIRSAAVGSGYFPDADPDILANGTFAPGDLVKPTPEGLLLVGRVSDFINVAGRKLNPAAVEDVLRTCPGVEGAVVFGIPHPTRGEEPIACVTGPATVETMQTRCASALPAWQCPRAYWLVETLPVNERGKLSRKALAVSYQARTK